MIPKCFIEGILNQQETIENTAPMGLPYSESQPQTHDAKASIAQLTSEEKREGETPGLIRERGHQDAMERVSCSPSIFQFQPPCWEGAQGPGWLSVGHRAVGKAQVEGISPSMPTIPSPQPAPP